MAVSPVRQVIVTLWPHRKDTTVTVVLRDSSGVSRWDRRVGNFSLPVGRVELSGKPLADVLRDLGTALASRYDPIPPEAGSGSPGGLQGGLKVSRHWEALKLDF